MSDVAHWTDAPIAGLDAVTVCEVMLKIPLLAQQFGHRSLEQTDAYLHPTTREARFVVDFVWELAQGGDLEAFIDRWYGGAEAGRALLRDIFAAGNRPRNAHETGVEGATA